jgi:glycosyltransferase involved in cell wall biosynthesis
MSPHSGKLIVVADPIWIGHHPMYFAQFTAAFIRLGAQVIALCPEPGEARREILGAVSPEVAADLDRHVTIGKIEPARRSLLGGRFEGDPVGTAQRWKQVQREIARAEGLLGRRADLVYFPYLDTYLRFLPVSLAPEILLGRPWAGLYLRNHHHAAPASLRQAVVMLGKGDALLRSASCRGIGVLDERFIPEMERFTGRTVRMFPDFTDTTLPEEPSVLAREIMAKAGGRTIIGMIGLERRKGLLTLLRAAELAKRRDLPYYFVGGGRIFQQEYTAEEWAGILKLANGGLENLHLDPQAGRIPTEADFNSLFSTFSVAWAAYENFQGSSNTLGKAAAFRIPCLASEGGCVGHRVDAYGTGLTIPQGDAERALDAIPLLKEGKDRNGQPLALRHADFQADHSLARLDALLGELQVG